MCTVYPIGWVIIFFQLLRYHYSFMYENHAQYGYKFQKASYKIWPKIAIQRHLEQQFLGTLFIYCGPNFIQIAGWAALCFCSVFAVPFAVFIRIFWNLGPKIPKLFSHIQLQKSIEEGKVKIMTRPNKQRAILRFFFIS